MIDDIQVRPLLVDDLQSASQLCLDAFMQSIAPTLGAEGIQTFRAIARVDAFAARMQQDNCMLLAETAGRAAGLIELKQGRHIAMLFIAPEQQRRGVGRRLLAEAVKQARCEQLSVSASLPSVPAYLRYGFLRNGEVGESAGLIYQPMQLRLPPSSA